MSDQPVIIFFGSDAICLPVLDYLIGEAASQCHLRAVISQPDRPQGRGKKLQPNPVAAWALENGVELLQPDKPDAVLAEWMLAENTAVALVMAYGHFLGKRVREAAEFGMFNFHGSILPKYRGASPVETAISMGETETGVCLMQVVKEMDAGGVADCEKVRIDYLDTSPVVRANIGKAVVPLLRRNLSGLLDGSLVFEDQNAPETTHCRKIRKEDGAIDFNQPAQEIYNRLRAFTPWPGGYFYYGDMRIKVGRATVEASDVAEPGTIISVDSGFRIATVKGSICFYELQRPGGRMLPISDFLRGYPIKVGEVLRGELSKPLLDGGL